jgi:hypothetical protein
MFMTWKFHEDCMTVKEQRKLEYRKEQTERRDRKKWR